jgi:hypothetical protein
MKKIASFAFVAILALTLPVDAQSKKINGVRIESATTAAAVECKDMVFENAVQVPDKEFVSMSCTFTFNGFADTVGDRVTFARNATTNTKQNAVKDRANALLGSFEPGNTLNNANIQVAGLPI